MATATEAPATMAEGPTQHTQNQTTSPAQLNEQQINFLLAGISQKRIGKDGKGFSHVEAWDIRRHLIRVFGFGGFDTDLLETSLVAQVDIQPSGSGGKVRYTVVYRVSVKLTVKVGGVELGHWHGAAIGDATNQPGLADAHDLALKTADSQALKRAAVNMGDQFGLSLYNNGSLEPVVNGSLAYMKPQEQPKLPEDPQVQPEPGPNADEPAIGRGEGPKETPKQAAASVAQSAPPLDVSDAVRAGHVTRLMGQVPDCWNNPLALSQIKADADKHQVLDAEVEGPPPGREWMPLRKLLDNRFAELKAEKDAERGAA